MLGDAAHAMTPNLGQGACQAIEDAYALAYYLASVADIEAAFAHYQAIRLPRAQSIVRQSRRIGAAGQLHNPILCLARNVALKMTPERVRDRSLSAVVGYDISAAVSV